MITPKFKKWAVDDYAGMDGGNPEKELWFCGIEPGKDKDFQFVFDISLSKWISRSTSTKLPYLTPPDKQSDPITDQFNTAVASILGAVNNEQYNNFSELYGKDGRCFKLNLYPIPMSNKSDECWGQEHYENTGLLTKIQYKVWCMDNRFPKLRELVTKYSPKTIICFGTTLLTEYSVAFADSNQEIFKSFKPLEVKFNNKNYPLHKKVINEEKTSLIVVPFPRKPVNYAKGSSLLEGLLKCLKKSV